MFVAPRRSNSGFGRSPIQIGFAAVNHLHGQPDGECRSLAFAGTGDFDASAVKFDELLDDRQAKAQPAMPARGARIGLAEAVEHVGQKLGLDSLARIGNSEFEMRVDALHRDLHLAALGRELDRVREQVPNDLLQPAAVAEYWSRVGIQHRFDANVLGVGGRTHRVDGGADDLRQVDGGDIQPHLARNDAAHIEQVFDELRLGFGVSLDDCQTFMFLAVVFRAKHELGVTQDRVERRSQFVRNG